MLALLWSSACLAAPPVEGITFAAEAGKFYVPLEEAASQLHWRIQRDDKTVRLGPNETPVVSDALRRLLDGVELIATTELQKAGAIVTPSLPGDQVTVSAGGSSFEAANSPKRVEISLAQQRLWAWQGGRLILETRISSGRHHSTPAGDFSAGPYKARMHYSHLFENAPMPWSVQINGHIFIHGFTYVPNFPASHGCIRLPLDGGNPAKFFYEWVDLGTPVRVMP